MVSVLPNQVFDQEDFNYNHYLEIMSLPTATTRSSATMEDSNKKVRKPYTITKSRKNWTDQEHEKFLEAIQLFDRDWKKIEAFVGSKTVIQIRSHAQKYFLKVQKNGKNEHVPPPRPKRKAAHPYPQKASKNAATMVSQVAGTIQSSATMLEPGYYYGPNSSSVLRNPTIITALPSRTYDSVQAVNASHVTKDDGGLAAPAMGYNCCDSSSNESTRTLSTFPGNNQGNQSTPVRVMPDFAQVYSFIGSVFDPSGSDHLQKLKQMDPINVETVLLLMTNLSINLRSLYDHRTLLLSYDDDSRKAKASSPYYNFHADKAPPYTAIPSV